MPNSETNGGVMDGMALGNTDSGEPNSEKCRKCGEEEAHEYHDSGRNPWHEFEPDAVPSGEPPNVTCTECKTRFFSANDREARCPHCGKHLMLFPAPSPVQAGADDFQKR